MVANSERLDIFRELGMTTQQAKVYLALSKLEQATVKTIARVVQTNRAEVYRVIPELEKRGLIKKIISNPIAFRATPLSEGLSILLMENAEKHKEIRREAEQFLRNLNNRNREKLSEDHQYRLTTGSKAEAREYSRNVAELQMSKDSIFDWKLALYVINRHFDEHKKALEKGAKMRLITHVPEDEEIPQTIQTLMKIGFFEVKSASTIPKASIGIFDKNSLHIVTIPNSNLKKIKVLRSSDPDLIELAQDYFELKWRSATTLASIKKHQ